KRMVLEKRAARLIERLEWDAQGTVRGSGRRVGVPRTVAVRTGLGGGGMETKSGGIYKVAARDDLALVVDKDEGLRGHLAEEQTERVDPKEAGRAGNAQADVAGDAGIETMAGNQAIGRGQLDALAPRFGAIGHLHGPAPALIVAGRLGVADPGRIDLP